MNKTKIVKTLKQVNDVMNNYDNSYILHFLFGPQSCCLKAQISRQIVRSVEQQIITEFKEEKKPLSTAFFPKLTPKLLVRRQAGRQDTQCLAYHRYITNWPSVRTDKNYYVERPARQATYSIVRSRHSTVRTCTFTGECR